MSDPQNKIPSFNDVMHKPATARGVPSFEDIMGDEPTQKKKNSAGSLLDASKIPSIGTGLSDGSALESISTKTKKDATTTSKSTVETDVPRETSQKSIFPQTGKPYNPKDLLDAMLNVGGKEAVSGSPIASATSSLIHPKEKVEQKEIDDPVKALTQDSKEKLKLSQAAYDQLIQNEYFHSAESTVQKGTNPNVLFQAQKRGQELVDTKKMYAANLSEHLAIDNYVKQNMFPTAASAQEYVNNKVEKTGGAEPTDNQTFNLAKEKVQAYDDVAKGIQESGGIEKWALNKYRENNPQFDKQVEYLEKDANIQSLVPGSQNDYRPAPKGSGLYDYRKLVGDATMGYVVANALQDPNVKEYVESKGTNEYGGEKNLAQEEYYHLSNNLLKEFPEYGTTIVANEISRERQRLGLNSSIANFDTNKAEQHNNEIAEKLYKNDPAKLEIYNQSIRDHQKKYIDVPGFFNRLYEGIDEGISGFGETFANNTKAEDIQHILNEQATQVQAGEKGVSKFLGDMGHMTGFVMTLAAPGGVMRGAGIPAALADKTAIISAFLGNNIKEANAKYPDDIGKASISALSNTAAFAALSDIFPAGKVNDAINGVKKELGATLNSLGDKEISNAAIKDAMNESFAKTIAPLFLKQHGKSVLEMLALTKFNQGLDKALGMDEQTYKEYHPEDEDLDVIKAMAVGNILPSAAATHGALAKRQFTKEAVWDAASNPLKYSRLVMNPSVPQDIKESIVKKAFFLNDTKQKLTEAGVPEYKQKTYLLHAANEKALQDQIDKLKPIDEPVLNKKQNEEIVKIKEQIKKSQEIKDAILTDKKVDADVLPQDIVLPPPAKPVEKKEPTITEKRKASEASSKWKENIKAIDERTDIGEAKKEKLKQQADEVHAKELEALQNPPPNSEQELLTTLHELSGEGLKDQDIQFFVDQASNAPDQFNKDYGEDITKELLGKATIDQLKKSREDAAKFEDNPNVPILDKIIAEREAPTAASQNTEIGDPTKQRNEADGRARQKQISEEFDKEGYGIELDYGGGDGDILVTKNGEAIDNTELPKNLKKLADEYGGIDADIARAKSEQADMEAANLVAAQPTGKEVQAEVPTVSNPALESVVTESSNKFSLVGESVDGRKVREKVPNMASIEATFNEGEYEVLSGVREVPMSEFELSGIVPKRGKQLAEEINDSGELNPLIVVIEKDGAYILEGANRFDALREIGAKSFPAKVVIDTKSFEKSDTPADQPNTVVPESKTIPVEGRAKEFIVSEDDLKGGEDVVRGVAKKGYPKVTGEVDGRVVRDGVPNIGSIEASLGEHEVLDGIREIPLSEFDSGEIKYATKAQENRAKELADEIKQSGEISPLIVVIDKNGPYILEGSNRFDALRELGAKSFPAKIVIDSESIRENKTTNVNEQSKNTQPSPESNESKPSKKEIPTMGEADQDSKGTGKEKVSASSKMRDVAAKIREQGLNSVLPDWAKADLPKGTEQAGFGGKSLDNAIAKAIEIVADAVDAGKEIADAIKEGYSHLKDYYSQNTKSFDEEQIRADFTNNINKIFEIPERKVTEDQQAGLSGIKKALVSKNIIEGVDLNKIGDKEMMALGRKIIDSGEVKPEALVEKIITEKQGVLTPTEVVALITYKADIDNSLREAYTKSNEKRTAGEDAGTLGVEIKDLERQADDFDVAAVITAQQQSMAFRLRKMMLDRNYNLTTEIEKYKKNNNGVIPAEVEARFRELDKELKDVKEKLANAEKKEVEIQEQEAVDNIKEDVARNGANYTDEEIAVKVQEGIQKEIDAIHEKLPAEKKRASDKAIAALERFQKKLRGKAYSDVGGFVAIVDAGVTTIKNAIKAGVAIVDAVELGISKIKELLRGEKWDKEDEFRKDMIGGFESEGISTKKKPKDTPTINDDGTVSIPNDMLRDLVARGITDIEGLTDAVHEKVVKELPGITKRQVRDYITEYGKTINPTADEIQKQLNTAKRVGRLLSELEDLENKKKRKTNPSAKQKITDKEKELKRQIKLLSKDIPLTEKEKADNLENTKDRIKQRIQELERKIKDKDFSKRQKPDSAKDDELIKLQSQKEKIQEEFDNAQYKNELKNRPFWKKAEDVALEILSAVPRALVASIDFSAPFVQGIWRLFSQPIKSFKAMGDMFSHFWSEKSQEEWMNKLKAKPFYSLLEASKLAISNKEGKASVKEGLFISNWINLLYDHVIAPAIAMPTSILTGGNVRKAYNIAKNLNPYQASQRAFDGYVNSIRVQSFIGLAKRLEKQGYTFESDPKVFEKAADFVNTTTGRGSLGAGETSSKWLNLILFAPRKVISEVKLFTPYAFAYYAKMPTAVRTKALLNFASFVTSFVATNALLWASRKDWDDDDDDDNFWNMNSSDFMTHKFGNQRVGFGGGAKTSLVFMSRLFSGKFTDQYGRTSNLGDRFGKQINTRQDLIEQFLLGKAAPSIALANKKLDEKKGLEVDDAELVKNITVPIWMQDAASLYKDNPAAIGGMFTALSIFGANVRTVDPSKSSSVKTFKIYQKNGNKVREATPQEDKKYKVEADKLYNSELESAKKGKGWGYNKYGELTINDNDIEKKGSFKDLDDSDKKELEKRLKSSASAKAKDKIRY